MRLSTLLLPISVGFTAVSAGGWGPPRPPRPPRPPKTPHCPVPLPPTDPLPVNLTLTALVGKNGLSALECWALTPELIESTSTGTEGALLYPFLGSTGDSSWAMFTRYTNAGLHQAPAEQYVMFMSGGGILSFPDPEDPTHLIGNYTVRPGQILLALDTVEVSELGHNSEWFAGTTAIQMPFANGPPDHVVLHDGGCIPPHM